MTTIGQAVSRVRNIIKSVKEDPFITDRFLYSLIIKYARLYIRRQEAINQLLKFNTLFRTLPCMDLIEVNKVEACCGSITSDCLMKRTELKIPNIMEAIFGPLFRTISSIDGSIEIFPTTPSTYASMTKTTTFKYNTRKYYWFLNGYLYFPDLEWDAVMVEGIFEGNLASYTCSTGSGDDECIIRQDQATSIPDFLFAEIEQQVLKDLGFTAQLPSDPATDDKQNLLR